MSCRFAASQTEWDGMEQHSPTLRKTSTYQLTPTPAQQRALESVLQPCRTLYNVALEQRKTWWQRGQGKRATYSQQQAESPDLWTLGRGTAGGQDSYRRSVAP